MRANYLRSVLWFWVLAGSSWHSAAGFAAENGSWQWAGWGGGGFYWCCAWHPTKDGVIYMGGDVAGVYKTEDKGLHWRLVNRGLTDYEVYSLAVDRQNPETVYAGTPEGFCKSTDGGEHWEFLKATGKDALAITADRRKSVRALAVDPTDGAVLYAGTPKGRLLKSIDGGQTWRKLDYMPAVQRKLEQPAAEPPAFSGKGSLALVYDSDEADWNKNGRTEKHFDPPVDWSAYSKMTTRFFVPARAPRLEAQLVVQTGDKWIWQGGPFVPGKAGAWTELALPLAGLKDLGQVRVCYVVVRSVQAGYQGEVYVDNVMLHGAPGGDVVLADWEKPGDAEGWVANRKIKDATFVVQVRQSAAPVSPRESGAIAAVTVSQANPRVVLAASSLFGVLKSEDAGESWQALATPASAWSVAVVPGDEKLLYAAFGADGVQKSTDGGKTWSAANSGLKAGDEIREVVLVPNDPQTVYAIGAKGWSGHFYRSTDGGQNWQAVRLMRGDRDANPTNPEDFTTDTPLSTPTNLTFNPRNSQELFMSANWRPCFSADGGQTWQERDRGADITCVTDIRFSGPRTYVTSMDEGLAVSEDGGVRWRQLCPRKYSTALSGHFWRVAVWAKEGGEKILATCSPWAEPPNRALVSEDGGKSFKIAMAGLPDYRSAVNCMWGQSYARALAADLKAPNIVYLGMDGDPEPARGRSGGGVFKSTDGGYTWKQLANQPGSRRAFYGLAVDPTEPRRLFWGACGDRGGLYVSEDAGESWGLACKNETWVFNVLVSPRGTVYCPGVNLWKSSDHGRTWKRISNFKERLSIVGLEVDPRDDNTIWLSRVAWGARAAGGVYKTTDGGTTWQEITGDLPYCKPTILRLQPETRELWAGGVGLFKIKQ